MRDIDWHEYERRKAALRQNIGSFEQYGIGIREIITTLEADADRAKVHEAKTTTAMCLSCRANGTLEPVAGYFDPHLAGVSASDPRKYEEGWRCAGCQGNFGNQDVEQIAA